MQSNLLNHIGFGFYHFAIGFGHLQEQMNQL